MPHEITLQELKKTSFLRIDRLDGRAIPLLACLTDDDEWEWWVPLPDGLRRMQGGEPIEAYYFAKRPAKEGDAFIAFSEFMLKRAYFKDVVHFVRAITDDLHNLGASIAKLDLFHALWEHEKSSICRRYVSTELEYVFSVCRSMFDLLQEIIHRLWRRFEYTDGTRKKTLRKSFADMVLHGDSLLSAKEIQEKYSIPNRLATFYHDQGLFFYWLREYRNRVDHGGQGFELVFITERGFAVSTGQEPFSSLNIWNKANTLPNGLGSVRSAVAYVIDNVLKCLDDFATIMSAITKPPYDISPEYHVYLRGERIEALTHSSRYIVAEPWIHR